MKKKENNAAFARNVRFSCFLLSLARGLSVALYLVLFFSTLMSYALPYAMKLAVDSFLSVRTSKPSSMHLLLYLSAIAVSVVLRQGERYLSAKQDQVIEHRFRDKVVSMMMRKDITAFKRHPYGQLETVMTNAISTVGNSIYCIIETCVIVPLGLVAGMAYIRSLSYVLVPLILAEVTLVYLVILDGTKKRAKAYKSQLVHQARYFGILEAIHKAYENIRMAFRVVPVIQKHREESEKYAQANVGYQRTQIQINTLIDLISGVLNITAIYTFYVLIGQGRATPGDYFAYVAMKEVIVGSMNGFIQLRPRIKELNIAVEEIDALVPIESLLKERIGRDKQSTVAAIEEISFNNAVFSYPTADVTYHLNYRFKAGRKYFLVGENGIGKTTMVRMITGLCPLDRGTILINGGVDINDLDEACKRRRIAVLPQNIVALERGLADILLEVDPEQPGVSQIIADFGADKYLALLGSGTNPDESRPRTELSGGEKKRILLAAVFAGAPDVIILDEPYAELDAHTKEVLTRYINELSLDRIVIVITHEMPSGLDLHNAEVIRMCRRGSKVVLQNGSAGL
ncbi:MAG: ATP-binding cassette domain-containing protein [Bacillota bacterium]|jgi:ABC-type bacteriocin/lantibiotic exporter with double-glycine peptidase domain